MHQFLEVLKFDKSKIWEEYKKQDFLRFPKVWCIDEPRKNESLIVCQEFDHNCLPVYNV